MKFILISLGMYEQHSLRSTNRYITRKDGSPLMDALVLWREAALHGKLARSPSRSPSPGYEYDRRSRLKGIEEESPYSDHEGRNSARSSADMSGTTISGGDNADGQTTTSRPSSSSWVRWWSRSRREERPDLRSMNTAPSSVVRPSFCPEHAGW